MGSISSKRDELENTKDNENPYFTVGLYYEDTGGAGVFKYIGNGRGVKVGTNNAFTTSMKNPKCWTKVNYLAFIVDSIKRHQEVKQHVVEQLEDNHPLYTILSSLKTPADRMNFETKLEEEILGVKGDAPRVFESGASRNSDTGKLDYEGFLSPIALKAYAEYMDSHRKLEDGSLRDSDNWQKGIPVDAYMKSMWRHFIDVWTNHRGAETEDSQERNLCAVIFNAFGMLHELKTKENNE